MKKLQQATQARDKAIDALVDSIEIPLPEKFVEHELTHARENIDNQLAQMNMSKEDYLKTWRRPRRSSTPTWSSSRSAPSGSASSSMRWPAPRTSR